METTNQRQYTAPGFDDSTAARLIDLLQERLHACNDLQLTLKHVHWNVVGPQFIAVHTMLDPQVEAVRGMADDLAERITTLGGVPIGTPGALVQARKWDDYSLGRATTQQHLNALAEVYAGVITSHRDDVEETEKLDPVTQDMLIGQLQQLELFAWFVRAHLEEADQQSAPSAGQSGPTA